MAVPYAEMATYRGTRGRVQGWTRPRPSTGGRQSQQGAHRLPPTHRRHPLRRCFFSKAGSLLLPWKHSQRPGILGICCGNGAALATLTEGTDQLRND